jgi:CRISPR-associated protein Csm4
MDRVTFTTVRAGELFGVEETFYNPGKSMWFALRTDFLSKEKLKAILRYIELTGFGKDASSGRGRIKIISVSEYQLPESNTPNGFMSISNFVPTWDEIRNSDSIWYSIFTKYPKVGGEFAIRDPFKKPVLFFEAGSVFKVKNLKNFYGQLISNVHSNPDIVQYAFAFPVKVKLEE